MTFPKRSGIRTHAGKYSPGRLGPQPYELSREDECSTASALFASFSGISIDPLDEPCNDGTHTLGQRWCRKLTNLMQTLVMSDLRLIAIFVLSMLASKGYSQEKVASPGVETGTIRGVVTYVANPQKPWRLGRYYIRNAKTGELAEAVVAISRRGLSSPDEGREAVTVTMDQKDFHFSPETVAIRTGDQVQFLNNDTHVHNVKTSHPEHSFNVTMPVGGTHTEVFKKATGINQLHQIDCVFHSAMRAWIFVFDHPWFYLTKADGSFIMEHVPVGEYRLDVVHPAGDLKTRQNIQVVAGQTATVDIRMQPVAGKP